MQEVKVNGTVNAPAEQVWEVVSDFNGLDTYVAAVADSIMEGSGVGAVRTLKLQDGGEVKEKLDSLDNEQRLLTYSIVESPLPIQNYMSTMQVRQLENNRSEFMWSSTFEVTDGSEEEMKETLKGLYLLGVEGLQNKF